MATADTAVGGAPRKRSGLSERQLAAAMISPSLVVIAIVAAYPIIYAIWLSLHEYSRNVAGLSRWSGLGNYTEALSSGEFWDAFRNTFVFTGVSVTLELIIEI